MKKWGIRIIGVLFLIWASLNLFGLITGTSSTKGFLGFDVGMTYNGKSLDVMTWIGVYVLAYTGYHLLRLNMQGRTWALIVLWFSTIGAGIFFTFILIGLVAFFIWHKPSYVTLYFFNRAIKLETPFSLLLTFGTILLFYVSQLYFLMRKDVKILFQKTDEIAEKTS